MGFCHSSQLELKWDFVILLNGNWNGILSFFSMGIGMGFCHSSQWELEWDFVILLDIHTVPYDV